MKGVVLVNRSGRVVECPAKREEKLLDDGYRRPTDEELADYHGKPVVGEGLTEGDEDADEQEELPAVSSLKKSEWLEMAEGLGVDADDSMTKAEIREAIKTSGD